MSAESNKTLRRCPNCGHTPLRQSTITDRFEYRSADEGPLIIEVPDVPVEICDGCGEQYLGPEAAKAQHRAVCRALGLLTPEEILTIRERYGPTQAEFAAVTGIGVATLSRWERGRLLPNQAMDSYLWLLQANPANVELLRRRGRPEPLPSNGSNLRPFELIPGIQPQEKEINPQGE